MTHVIFYEAFAEEEAAIRKYLPAYIQAEFTAKTIQAENHQTPPAALISVRTQSVIPAHWVSGLTGVLTRSTGYDHLTFFLEQSEIEPPCGYLPFYCSRAVAEQALLMSLSLLRRLRAQIRAFKRFQRDYLTGQECLNRHLLVLGVGHIGKEVALLASGLGMKVKGVDIEPDLPAFNYVSLDEGLSWADVIVCALPLTPSTEHLLNYEKLKSVRPGTILVNISRGEITPIADLKRLLDEEILGGLALDVFEDEKQLGDSLRHGTVPLGETGSMVVELKDRVNVLFTPHNAFNTVEAVERKAQQSCRAVEQFLKNGTFPDPVPVDQ